MKGLIVAVGSLLLLGACQQTRQAAERTQPVYADAGYAQDYAVKYFPADGAAKLLKVCADRNGNIQVLTEKGLLKPFSGKLLYPGTLVEERYYRPTADKNIKGLIAHENQFVYLDDKAVLSNAWAGELYSRYTLPGANLFAGGASFDFLISDGTLLHYVKDSKTLWQGSLNGVRAIRYDAARKVFWLLTPGVLAAFSVENQKLETACTGSNFTCFSIGANGKHLIVGTTNGYFTFDTETKKETGERQLKLPWTELTDVEFVNGKLWFGSTRGAFMLRDDGKFNYYASQRWLPGDNVVDVAPGPDSSVLVLTDRGLSKLCFERITLHDKAMFYEAQVRQRHIRYGFNCDVSVLSSPGNLGSAQTGSHDSDNLWTGMYVGSQVFRYRVTKDPEAKQNCIEAFEAMERLHTLAPISGLFGRTFERNGIALIKEEYRDNIEAYWYPGYARTESSWRHVNPEWDWRGSASSDQTVGQYFALTMIAQYMDDAAIRQRAVNLIDKLSAYILDNNLQLIDYDGRPSLWGRWNPEYVNRFQTMIGDRRLCSSNIISFLQIAYHFTGKEKYKATALELLYREGYLENLTRPVKDIGKARANADAWSKMLSSSWNNSDDEMYFLGYWGLYPYALNDTLKQQYKDAIRDHWEFERSEKDGLWNLCYAMTGAADFDLDATTWYLREFPLDMVEWSQHNSHRQDIEQVPPNFREETTREILPPDERPELKHNRNLFTLDKETSGTTELDGGETFLLPYWMGRYLGVISAPATPKRAIGERF